MCCRRLFGRNIAAPVAAAAFADYFDIAADIDGFREFVALELFGCCVHFGCRRSTYSNIAGLGSLVIAYVKRSSDVAPCSGRAASDGSAAFEVLRVT